MKKIYLSIYEIRYNKELKYKKDATNIKYFAMVLPDKTDMINDNTLDIDTYYYKVVEKSDKVFYFNATTHDYIIKWEKV